jgi:coenzyme F420-0:L-glutamate ligase/coenzyme F420-1:gamma-L-glutamate ligase
MDVIGLKIPLIKAGDDLVQIVLEKLTKKEFEITDGDVLVVTEKIVAKSQGRLVDLHSIEPSEKAILLAEKTDKDPRLVELILRESIEVIKTGSNFIITETKDGLVCANAGIDSSNIEDGKVKLLPKDPDKFAEKMRKSIEDKSGKKIGVVIADSFGRPFRSGSVGVAIGSSGITALWDRRGEQDLFDNELQSTRVAVADSIASAANLVTGDAAEGIPVVLIRGLNLSGKGKASDLIRDKDEDLFRG